MFQVLILVVVQETIQVCSFLSFQSKIAGGYTEQTSQPDQTSQPSITPVFLKNISVYWITIHVSMFIQVVSQVFIQVLIQLLIQVFIQVSLQLWCQPQIQNLNISILVVCFYVYLHDDVFLFWALLTHFLMQDRVQVLFIQQALITLLIQL